MKEFPYFEISEPVEINGIIVKRDLMVRINDSDFSISVATPGYIARLREYNKSYSSELKIDENILPMDSVEDLAEVMEKLEQMPQEEIDPYLVPQQTIEAE